MKAIRDMEWGWRNEAVVRGLLGYCGVVRRMIRVPIRPWLAVWMELEVLKRERNR